MPQGPGFFSRAFGSGRKEVFEQAPKHSNVSERDQHAGVLSPALHQQQLVWDEAKPDPRPDPRPGTPQPIAAQEQSVQAQHAAEPTTNSKKKKKSAFKHLFAKWKQQLSHRPDTAAPAQQHTTAAVPASSLQDADQQKDQAHPAAQIATAAVQQPTTGISNAPQRPAASSTARQGSTAAHSNTPVDSPAAATSHPEGPAAATRHNALAVPEADRLAARPQQHQHQHQQQQPPRSKSSLQAQIEQLIALEPAAGQYQPAAAAGQLPWAAAGSAGRPPPPPAAAQHMPVPSPARASRAGPGARTASGGIQPPAAAQTTVMPLAAPAAPAVATTHSTRVASGVNRQLPTAGPSVPERRSAPPVAAAAAPLPPPAPAAWYSQGAKTDAPSGRSSNALAAFPGGVSSSTENSTSSGVYIIPSSSSRPAVSSSAADPHSSTDGSRQLPATQSANVGTFAAYSGHQQQKEPEGASSSGSGGHGAAAAGLAAAQAVAASVGEADVTRWLSRCAVLQVKLAGGLMAADGKLQALTARSQLVQGILVSLPMVSLPQGGQRHPKHAHLAPKLQAERARIAAELSALKQRLQLLVVAINRLAAARQYLGSQTGAAMAAADRVAILQLVLADVADRLAIWDWEELEGLPPLGDAGQQIRDMLTAAAAAAAAAGGGKASAGTEVGGEEYDHPADMVAGGAAAPAGSAAPHLWRHSQPAATVAAAEAHASAASGRPPPGKSASWHHPQQQQQRQLHHQLHQQWPRYNLADPLSGSLPAGAAHMPPDTAGGRPAGGRPAALPPPPPPPPAAAAASIGGGGLSHQALEQHNTLQQASGGRTVPQSIHGPAAAASADSVPAAPARQQHLQQRQRSDALHGALARQPAGAAAAGTAAADLAATHTGHLHPAAAAGFEGPLSSCNVAVSYAAHSGGKVGADDELLLQYLGLPESGSNSHAAADQAGLVSGSTFVRSRRQQQQQQSGSKAAAASGPTAASQQQQYQGMYKRPGRGRGTVRQERYSLGFDSDSEDEHHLQAGPGRDKEVPGEEEGEDEEAGQVSDDVWGTVNSIFSTAANSLQAAGLSASESGLSYLAQRTAEGSAGGVRMSLDAPRGSRGGGQAAAEAAAAAEASRSRAAMLAESLAAAQLLVQQDDSAAKDCLSTCFEALRQLAAATSALGVQPAAGGAGGAVRAAAAAVGGNGSRGSHMQRQRQDMGQAGGRPSDVEVARRDTSRAAAPAAEAPIFPAAATAAGDEDMTAEAWQSAEEDSSVLHESGDSDDSGSREAAGASATFAPTASGVAGQGSPTAATSRHVHTLGDDTQQQQHWRRASQQQQQQQFDFSQPPPPQQQQQQQVSMVGTPWSSWAPSSFARPLAAVAAFGEHGAPAAADVVNQAFGQQLAGLQSAAAGPAPGEAAEPAGSVASLAPKEAAGLPTEGGCRASSSSVGSEVLLLQSAGPSLAPSAAAGGRRASSSSAGGSSEALQLQSAGPSLTVRDLLQMLSTALQASAPSEDLASLPVADLLRQQSLQQ